MFQTGHEPFKIEKLAPHPDDPAKTVYKLRDEADEEIYGKFYPEEVQKIITAPDDIFQIEKVIRKRKIKGVEEALIKWKGYSSNFNSWIPAADIISHGRRK